MAVPAWTASPAATATTRSTGGPGIDGYDCGPGNDVIHVGVYEEWGFHSTGCESYVIDDPQ